MSKRARITLDLDPQEAIGENSAVSAEEKPPTRPAAKAEPKQRARATARPKPKVAPKRQSTAGATVKPRPRRALNAETVSEVAASGNGAEAETVTAAADIPPGEAVPTGRASAPAVPAGFSLGTVLKVAVVGLAVISAVLWLKRKP